MDNLAKVSEIFEIKYGVTFELINLTQCKSTDFNSIPFVSRTEKNNGVSAFVERLIDIEPNPAHSLSVAVGGSVLSTFYQVKPYYSGFHIFVLVPKDNLSIIEMLFYAKCISANKYKYNYGRQANRTLKDILIPSKMPENLNKKLQNFKINIERKLIEKPINLQKVELNINNWQSFRYDEIFEVKKGKRLTKEDFEEGKTPFIGAIDSNNGYRDFVGQKPIHKGNTITVNYNGSVGEAFYQPNEFWASDDVNVLYPKFRFNKYIAMFIIPIIKKEKYRFNYGRKWESSRMRESTIKLPVNKKGEIDTDLMENYIKSFPYSSTI
ncbi:MAG: restriction endonuclease subunit S [Flavobacterium sp.]|nr:restriction endonuclease subunit S [Flavobacterium sp.]